MGTGVCGNWSTGIDPDLNVRVCKVWRWSVQWRLLVKFMLMLQITLTPVIVAMLADILEVHANGIAHVVLHAKFVVERCRNRLNLLECRDPTTRSFVALGGLCAMYSVQELSHARGVFESRRNDAPLLGRGRHVVGHGRPTMEAGQLDFPRAEKLFARSLQGELLTQRAAKRANEESMTDSSNECVPMKRTKNRAFRWRGADG